MYIVRNNTKNTTIYYEGGWPNALLENLLEKGNDIIVISLYSNTIKVPNKEDYCGITEWDWVDFPLLNKMERVALSSYPT